MSETMLKRVFSKKMKYILTKATGKAKKTFSL